jgi:hypothetical protein
MNFSEDKGRETVEEAIRLIWESINRREFGHADIPPLPTLWEYLRCTLQRAREQDAYERYLFNGMEQSSRSRSG